MVRREKKNPTGIGRLSFRLRVEKENRCEQSISQRGSSDCVDCTEIMYSAVQNGKSARGERKGAEGVRGRVRESGSSPRVTLPHVALRAPPPVSPSPADGVTMVCKGD